MQIKHQLKENSLPKIETKQSNNNPLLKGVGMASKIYVKMPLNCDTNNIAVNYEWITDSKKDII